MGDLPITTGVLPVVALLWGIAAFGALLVHRSPGWSTARVPYLTVDVSHWILVRLQIDPDPRKWAVGLSAGGTCAVPTATPDPAPYPTVLAVSVQDDPGLENGDDTVGTVFDGDQNAYDAIDPMAILASTRFPSSAGFFAAGADDDTYGPQTRTVYEAAEAAGMSVQYAALPGGHDVGVWSAALALATPWQGPRLGIAP